MHRDRIDFIFDELPELPALEGSNFVFAHVLSPHPPFVFDENGRPNRIDRPFELSDGNHFIDRGGTREEYVENFPKQTAYVNKRIIEAVDRILEASSEPPIIIIHSDHGPGSMLDWDDIEKTNLKERMSILNAYYFPDGRYDRLYQDISPVNTFRVLFNEFFNAEFELLSVKCYFAEWDQLYDLADVTEEVKAFSEEEPPVAR